MEIPQPLAGMPEEKLILLERRHEYDDVDTYVFKSSKPIPYEAGQYGHVRLYGMPPDVRAVREFSFASAPHEDPIYFGVDSRSGSPYQQRLKSLQAGDEAGLFKIKRHMLWPPEKEDVVMIAGGVGITPFRSFLLDRAHKKLPIAVSVIHAGREFFLYKDEITKLSDYMTADREGLSEAISTSIRGHGDAAYYVAGSPSFVEAVAKALKQAGVTDVQSDAFKGTCKTKTRLRRVFVFRMKALRIRAARTHVLEHLLKSDQDQQDGPDEPNCASGKDSHVPK
ncbi:FAD-dependent oxidoreductase [Candidatus Kaiserbacteria bacterium]|nr:FAD-dependent oxidoreductase [Candidatus Kaiserbacteria bacterium]